jgi:fatty-acid desaturase
MFVFFDTEHIPCKNIISHISFLLFQILHAWYPKVTTKQQTFILCIFSCNVLKINIFLTSGELLHRLHKHRLLKNTLY